MQRLDVGESERPSAWVRPKEGEEEGAQEEGHIMTVGLVDAPRREFLLK